MYLLQKFRATNCCSNSFATNCCKKFMQQFVAKNFCNKQLHNFDPTIWVHDVKQFVFWIGRNVLCATYVCFRHKSKYVWLLVTNFCKRYSNKNGKPRKTGRNNIENRKLFVPYFLPFSAGTGIQSENVNNMLSTDKE